MTRAEALALTIERANESVERQLELAEIDLLDTGATLEEVENAVGRDGYLRQLFEEHRDREIAAVMAWLNGNDNTLH